MSETRRESIGFKLAMSYKEFMSRFSSLLNWRLTAEVQLVGRYVDAPKASHFPVSNRINCVAIPILDGEEHCLLLCDGAEDFVILPREVDVRIVGIEIQVFIGEDDAVQTYSAVVSETAWVQKYGDRIKLPAAFLPEPMLDMQLALAAVREAEKAFE